ncbi:MAG: hypothetical protein ACXWLM_05520 [Myxococcales bacterium]
MASTLLAILIAAGSAQRYEGRVQRFDAKSGKIFLLLNDHSTGNWTLSPQAKVFGPDHKPLARTALRPGEQVLAAVSADGSVQTIWIQESDWGKPYQGGKVRRWDGRVVAVKKRDPPSFEVQKESGNARMTFAANPATKYLRAAATGAPQPGSPDDIKDGATVRVLMNAQHKVVEVVTLE